MCQWKGAPSSVLRVEVILASYLDVAYHVNLGVVTEHSLLDLLHVLPSLLLLNVDSYEDFVYPFKESCSCRVYL